MIANNDTIEEDEVIITPFNHQVGGHKVVLQISRKFICKPREEAEVIFYRKLPDCLKDCVPHFKGEIQVRYVPNEAGFLLLAKLPHRLKQEIEHETNSCIDSESVNNGPSHNPLNYGESDEELLISDSKSEREDHPHISDWSEKCLERTMHQYALWSTNSSQQFIVLENLLDDYKSPSILDIKLGRKQRLGGCSEEKRKLLESRCAHSTSASLGFRICGMQLFQKHTGEYISHDKYVGRSLDDAGATLNLKKYFHDGISLRNMEIEFLINKLNRIQKALSEQTVFIFLSVSLLLIYDSDDEGKVDARLIDFANAANGESLPEDQVQTDCNEDLLFGLSNIINILQSFLS